MPTHKQSKSTPHKTNPGLEPAMRIMDRIFDFASEAELKQLLWNWFKITISSSYHKESANQKEEVLLIYEKISTLIGASADLYEFQKKQQVKSKKQ